MIDRYACPHCNEVIYTVGLIFKNFLRTYDEDNSLEFPKFAQYKCPECGEIFVVDIDTDEVLKLDQVYGV